eukprot:scaffold20.g7876.t1
MLLSRRIASQALQSPQISSWLAGQALPAVCSFQSLLPAGAQEPLAPSQQQHARWLASSAGSDRSVKRLQQASARAAARRSPPQRELQPAPPAEEVVETRAGLASELQVASVVDHAALIVTRPIEWGNVLLGFEQANRYTVYDQHGSVVALLAEEEGSLGRALGRQLLRTRRPFTATVFSPDGQVIFVLRRPFYLINSSMTVEDGEGNVVGACCGCARSDRNGDFELKDGQGRTLALIDRNFSGFGKELFTDAGKYVIHFGSSPGEAAHEAQATVAAAHPDRPPPPLPASPPAVTALARLRTDVSVIPTSTGDQLVVKRPLQLDERMVALAAAISVDYDYFHRHSHHGGGMLPFLYPVPPVVPYPVPTGGAAEGAAGEAAGEAVSGEAAATGAGDAGDWGGSSDSGGGDAAAPPADEPLERDLGGDDWPGRGGGGGGDGGGWFGGGSSDDSGGGDDDGGGWFDTLRDVAGALGIVDQD